MTKGILKEFNKKSVLFDERFFYNYMNPFVSNNFRNSYYLYNVSYSLSHLLDNSRIQITSFSLSTRMIIH